MATTTMATTTTDSSIAALRRELRETQSALDALDAREDVERELRRARAAQTSTAAMCDAMDVVRRRHARGGTPVRDSAPLAVDDDDEEEEEEARRRRRARSDVPSADVETLDAVARACRAELSRDSAHSNVGVSVARRVRAAVGMARAVKTTEPYALFFEAYVAREGGSSRMDAIVDAFDGIQRAKRDAAVLVAAAPRADGARIAAAELEFCEQARRALEDACVGDEGALECIRRSYDKFCG
jgi:hypothetical protein